MSEILTRLKAMVSKSKENVQNHMDASDMETTEWFIKMSVKQGLLIKTQDDYIRELESSLQEMTESRDNWKKSLESAIKSLDSLKAGGIRDGR